MRNKDSCGVLRVSPSGHRPTRIAKLSQRFALPEPAPNLRSAAGALLTNRDREPRP